MTSIANCPKIEELDDLRALIEQFGTAWAATPLRPKPSQETIQAWSVLIEKWIDDASLPLFVRKHANIEVLLSSTQQAKISTNG